MKARTKANTQADSPLLVMAIKGGWFGHEKNQCIFAAVRLLPSVVATLRAISQVSHDIGGTELLLGHWPVLWDQDPHLGIDKTVWRVSGNRHWAEAFDADGQLLGRTVYLDARERSAFICRRAKFSQIIDGLLRQINLVGLNRLRGGRYRGLKCSSPVDRADYGLVPAPLASQSCAGPGRRAIF